MRIHINIAIKYHQIKQLYLKPKIEVKVIELFKQFRVNEITRPYTEIASDATFANPEFKYSNIEEIRDMAPI